MNYNNFSIIEFAEELNELISENIYLRKRVKELEQKEQENSEWITKMYNEQRKSVGETLGALLK